MLCPFKKADTIGACLCNKENCGFYSCESQKCTVASLYDITTEIAALSDILNCVDDTLVKINKTLGLIYSTK